MTVLLSGASPARGAGAGKSGLTTVLIEFTLATNAVTVTKGQRGFSLADFSSGAAALTFPKEVKILSGKGYLNTDTATAADRRDLIVRGQNYTAGTAVVRCVVETTRASTVANGTYTLELVVA